MLSGSLGPHRGSTRRHSFVKMVQGAKKPFADFISRLKEALQPDVRDLLLHTLAYENASPDCQPVLQPIKAAGGSQGMCEYWL